MSEKKKGGGRSGSPRESGFRGGSGADDYEGFEYLRGRQGFSTYTGPTGQPTTYVTPEPKCSHEGTTPVVTLADTRIEVYAASKMWAKEASYLADFVIDCGAHISSDTTSAFVKAKGTLRDGDRERITGLNELIMTVPPVAQLDWPDQGIPAGGAAFWLGLVNILPDPGKVLVCCIGGHGRTGTCLASLLLVTNPGMTAKAVIDFVRAKHCKHAIETLAQERYLCALSEQMRRLGARARQLVLERAAATQGGGEPRIDEVPPALDGVVVKKGE